MDTANALSLVMSKILSMNMRKLDIPIRPFTDSQTPEEFLQSVKVNKPKHKTYELNYNARKYDHRIGQLPNYHSH
jgi:hypothetical protein